ncbi:hypothetical protein A3Q56_01623 [Intoshia linei]|uniref:non-specific serine/threonine protein kinase n=1 Tax=Intoshia linei TaxID=1819745 RepID=A0A177B8I7_9BILA|nr:hypothetical protein A3Q56_01623 [Intoshia linei]
MKPTDFPNLHKIDFDKLKDPKGLFIKLAVIGKGTYGTVYKARHLKSKSICAIKVITLKISELEEIKAELNILKLNSIHENIATYYGAFKKKRHGSYLALDELWIVMEYCGLGTVADVVKVAKKPTVKEAWIGFINLGIIKGLQFLHDNCGIHRDLKAQNVLVSSDITIKLVDFGVGAQMDSALGQRNTCIGTPFWMAPEVIECEYDQTKTYDSMSDIWSLGIVTIELCEGRPPHSDYTKVNAFNLILRRNPPLFKDKFWSPHFVDFLSKCVKKKPELRYNTKRLLEHPFISRAKNNSDSTRSHIKKCLEQRMKHSKQSYAMERDILNYGEFDDHVESDEQIIQQKHDMEIYNTLKNLSVKFDEEVVNDKVSTPPNVVKAPAIPPKSNRFRQTNGRSICPSPDEMYFGDDDELMDSDLSDDDGNSQVTVADDDEENEIDVLISRKQKADKKRINERMEECKPSPTNKRNIVVIFYIIVIIVENEPEKFNKIDRNSKESYLQNDRNLKFEDNTLIKKMNKSKIVQPFNFKHENMRNANDANSSVRDSTLGINNSALQYIRGDSSRKSKRNSKIITTPQKNFKMHSHITNSTNDTKPQTNPPIVCYDKFSMTKVKKRFTNDILCADFWGINLLVGTTNGLNLLDRSGNYDVVPLINRRRFDKITVNEATNSLVTISGNKRRLRIYYLSSLKQKIWNLKEQRLNSRHSMYTNVFDLIHVQNFKFIEIDRVKFIIVSSNNEISILAWSPHPYERFMSYKTVKTGKLTPKNMEMVILDKILIRILFSAQGGFYKLSLEDCEISPIFTLRINEFDNAFNVHLIKAIPETNGKEFVLFYNSESVRVHIDNGPMMSAAVTWGQNVNGASIITKNILMGSLEKSIEYRNILDNSLIAVFSLANTGKLRFLCEHGHTIFYASQKGSLYSRIIFYTMDPVSISQIRRLN